ncbi:hypothetical protein PENSPDRAFT_492648 [Peniophora sp. CONT]|nr:hypothetical protein PENSPDRAFT_492648 [Peniophora sp. CONT]
MARTIRRLSTNYDRSLVGSSTPKYTALSRLISAVQPPTTAAHKEHKKTCWLLRLPPEILYQILIELDPKSLFRVEPVCRDLRSLLAQPYVWYNVVSRILERPYLDLPLTPVEARGVLKFFTTRKKKCDVSDQESRAIASCRSSSEICRSYAKRMVLSSFPLSNVSAMDTASL